MSFKFSLLKFKQYKNFFENQEIDKAIREVFDIISETNVYVDKQAPWNLKNTNTERMNTVLSVSIEIIRRATILLYPIMPESCSKILSLHNIDNNDINISNYEFIPSEPIIINDPYPIFPRIELND